MDFVNSTPVVAALAVADLGDDVQRFGMVTAKATWRFDATGLVELDGDDPVPLFEKDEETDLGLLPRDDMPQPNTAFDVILLGVAHAPNDEPVTRMSVAFSIGKERRELAVFGDREWVDQSSFSSPEPFENMPLTWERAFGGTCEVLIDLESPVDIPNINNPVGRGMNFEEAVKGLCDHLGMPDGYPVWDATRRLPNIEDPASLIAQWDDAPLPASWATMPLTSPQHAMRALDIDGDPQDPDSKKHFTGEIFRRATLDCGLSAPAGGATVLLEGLHSQPQISFQLPSLRVFADVAFGDETGAHELVPQLLVLLPEEMRFYLVFRSVFPVPYDVGEERSARLRLDDGWFWDNRS